MRSAMNMFPTMFTNNVCFLKVIHTPSCKPLLHRGVIQEFINDFHNGDYKFMIEHNAHAVEFLDKLRFDPNGEIDFIDYFIRMSSTYPFLVQLSTVIPNHFQYDAEGKANSWHWSEPKKYQNQWVWVESMEQASILAIEFSDLVRTNAILDDKYPM